jgi:hypothetical protein
MLQSRVMAQSSLIETRCLTDAHYQNNSRVSGLLRGWSETSIGLPLAVRTGRSHQ